LQISRNYYQFCSAVKDFTYLQSVVGYIIDMGLNASITRQKSGRGFAYYQNGRLITDKAQIKYLRSLAIPPAWQNVLISVSKTDKILAKGTDAAGRQQAIYHPAYRAAQDEAKFARILQFGEHLPKIRRQVEKDLASRKLGKDKVLACIVKLMDEAYFRVGNEQYAKEHHHYGITTLRSKHADITSTSVIFDFIGKSGQKHHKRINDRQIARIIKQLDELPGYEIFKYVGDDGQVHNIDSNDVNSYIKQHMGQQYSAKDFRTWGGTLLAAAELAAAERASNQRELKKLITACVKNVAKRLGNTPAVTRSSYIDPRILYAFESNELSRMRQTIDKIRPRKYLKPEEQGILKLLQKTT
jgi:DNA topoisomerase-1